MPPSLRDEIDRLPYDADGIDTWLHVLARVDRADDLERLLGVYNWDDGFAVPRAVAEHPACDLGIALKLFWSSDAERFLSPADLNERHNASWFDFCAYVTSRIVDGRYAVASTSFTIPLNGIARKKLEKRGVPAILISDVAGKSSP